VQYSIRTVGFCPFAALAISSPPYIHHPCGAGIGLARIAPVSSVARNRLTGDPRRYAMGCERARGVRLEREHIETG